MTGSYPNVAGKISRDTAGSGELEVPLFDFGAIAAATEHFSANNAVGIGGFGPVYKGKLAGNQLVAMKRLAKNSSQGVDEFMNEVRVIGKLQHRNLVRLLGCCIDGEERILVYEYMPNGSLDSFLFKKEGEQLNWAARWRIIEGIARGLLYLHQDSRLRIIHRDLKASNVLLDDGMNPKISDFGTARIFLGDASEGITGRVVGTYGYMSPEFAMDGSFSLKSDVFSFGVLVLEIISGRRNRAIFHSDQALNLLGDASSVKQLEGPKPTPTVTISAFALLPSLSLKLTSSNFLLWRTQMYPYLKSLHLLHHIENEPPLTHIRDAQAAKEAWDALVRSYASSTRSRLLELHSQLYNLKKGNMTAVDYVQTLKNLGDHLSTIGHPIEDATLIEILLRGLGNEYTHSP